MFRTFLRTIPPTLLLLLAMACGGSAAPEAGSSAPTAAAAQPTALPQPTTPPTPTESPADENLSLNDYETGLSSLDSFRTSFKVDIDVTENGEQKQGTVEITQEVVRASQSRRIRIAATGDLQGELAANEQPGTLEFIRLGDTSYMYNANAEDGQQCISFSGDRANAMPEQIYNAQDLIGSVEQAKLVGSGETVNGIATTHYRFDQASAITINGISQATGDIWIAQDGGYLVKYVGTASGQGGEAFGEQGEGTMSWEYNLTDVGAVQEIALPEACAGQGASGDIPAPPDAAERASFGGMQTFVTTASVDDVVAFYRAEMPAQGWTAGEERLLARVANLTFSKEGRKLTITITSDGSKTNVLVADQGQ